ncbi:hypothetical protein NC652_029880 [Populus alba x Populus x berolinensis]|nr:hypothetical protein NC652_029880 [Populus alba x Populus x berolinensis]
MNTKHDAACRLMKYPADPGRNWLDESTTHKICPKKARTLIMFRVIQRKALYSCFSCNSNKSIPIELSIHTPSPTNHNQTQDHCNNAKT